MSDTSKADLRFLSEMSNDYPGISTWYIATVIPGLATGERRICRLLRHDRLVAIGIAKKTYTEAKICTVRVAPDYANRGLGLQVFDDMLHWLNVDQPHLTVSERMLPRYQRIFDWYGFKLTSYCCGRYRAGVTEFGFNDSSDTLHRDSRLVSAQTLDRIAGESANSTRSGTFRSTEYVETA